LDKLVRNGVVAVVSAGNIGAGTVMGGVGAEFVGNISDIYGQLSTITDPGNAERAITVGSTHRETPQRYGVTYNSSKGPTLDGRVKPDLVAPGERITSAATGRVVQGVSVLEDPTDPAGVALYVEGSGTSLAAAHVSGVIAAFLSVRGGFIDNPEGVKELFKNSAIDLKRHEFYQGKGLINLMKALGETS
jgi:subtilisin family serine protease